MVNIIGRAVPMQPQEGGIGSVFETLAKPFMDTLSGDVKRSSIGLNSAKTSEIQQALQATAALADLARNGNINSNEADAQGILAGKQSTFGGGYANTQTLRSGAPLQGDAVARTSLMAGIPYGSTGQAFAQEQAGKIKMQGMQEATKRRIADDTPEIIEGPNGPTYVRRGDAIGKLPLLSTDQQRARIIPGALAGATPEQQQRFALGATPEPDILNASTATGTIPVIPTPTGFIHAQTRQPVTEPILTVGKLVAPTAGGLDSPKSQVLAAAQKAEVAGQRANDIIAYTRQLTANPMNVGISGWVKETAQDAAAVASNLATGLGYKGAQQALADMQAQAANNPDVQAMLPGLFQFDPNLPKLQTSYDMLVYSLAGAIAGQEGRELSTADVGRAQRAFGDPRSLFATKENLNARLDAAQDLLDITRGANQRVLRGAAAPPLGPAQPRPVTSTVPPPSPGQPVPPPVAPAPQAAPPAQAAADPIQQAKDAIARGADPHKVIQRLRQNGINPEGQF